MIAKSQRKPKEIANHLNDYLRRKIYKLMKELSHGTDNNLSIMNIKKYMENKLSHFEFSELNTETVEKLIKLTCNNKQPGIDNIADTLVRIAGNYIANPICHIMNISLKQSIFPQA